MFTTAREPRSLPRVNLPGKAFLGSAAIQTPGRGVGVVGLIPLRQFMLLEPPNVPATLPRGAGETPVARFLFRHRAFNDQS